MECPRPIGATSVWWRALPSTALTAPLGAGGGGRRPRIGPYDVVPHRCASHRFDGSEGGERGGGDVAARARQGWWRRSCQPRPRRVSRAQHPSRQRRFLVGHALQLGPRRAEAEPQSRSRCARSGQSEYLAELDHREVCLKSLLVRPSQSTSGLSLSDDAMWIALVGWLNLRFALSVVGLGSPVATWPWSVQGGSGRPRRPCSERVVAARALSSTCMPSALRLSQSAPQVLCPSGPAASASMCMCGTDVGLACRRLARAMQCLRSTCENAYCMCS